MSSTLNPEQHSTINTQHSFLNPEFWILNHKHSALNHHQLSTLNPQPSTLNPQPSTLRPQSPTPNLLNPRESSFPTYRNPRAASLSNYRDASTLFSRATLFPNKLRGYRGGGWWRTQLERPERPCAPPPLWGSVEGPQSLVAKGRPDAAGLAQVALGREEPWPLARLGCHHWSPSTGLARSVGVATGVRVGGSHGLCAPRGLLVGYCGG